MFNSQISSIPQPTIKHPSPAEGNPKVSSTICGPAASTCAKFTKSAAFLLHPDCSFFLQGIKLMNEPQTEMGGAIVANTFGPLMLMASPVEEIGRFILGGAAVTGGAIGTAATSAAYVVEKATRETVNASKWLLGLKASSEED